MTREKVRKEFKTYHAMKFEYILNYYIIPDYIS